MNLETVFSIVAAAWGVSEIILGVRTRAKDVTRIRDRGSLAILWTVIAVALIAGAMVRSVTATTMHQSAQRTFAISLALLILGVSLRWTAILTLGRWFTSNVAIGPGHRIVRSGVYRVIRHPSYSGMLLAFAAIAVAQHNWLSLIVVVVPITAAVLYRIRVEEAALLEAFGQEYCEYCNSTWRLLPGLY